MEPVNGSERKHVEASPDEPAAKRQKLLTEEEKPERIRGKATIKKESVEVLLTAALLSY